MTDDKTLAALQLAAKFVLDYAEAIDHYNGQAMDILKMNCPSATHEAAEMTQKESIQLRKDLDAVLDALKGAGIDD
ncbi:hypothetical protein AQI95_24685 [Streptomyces yokosukanensis]|uniref:Uncharacterized protein n=1 Tax=Streptomyces yokosukanensis TaxID=67386 RepID=A0A101P1G9_9ACTN|nr:hypothetical protein [Streptomyces yokosukanensis]KUN03157.1 hypothetical protein AQI95_24685 [Streptomyces yokosukanensis]